MLLLVALVCLVAVVLAYQVTRTGIALRRAQHDVATLSDEVGAGDLSGARVAMRDLQHQGRVAHGHSDNLLWKAAGVLPWIGTDVTAVRTASAALDDTARAALPPALRIYQGVRGHQVRSQDGRFDPRAIAALAPSFVQLRNGVVPSQRRLDAIDPDHVKLGTLRTATRELQSRLDSLGTFARAGVTATRVLPAMLGADGPRRYLLVEQTNAEIRATGGLPGAFSVVDVRAGRIKLGRQISDADFPALFPRPVVPLTHDELQLHTDQLGIDVRAANVTPDAPRAAQILAAMYHQRFRQQVDGVVFMDPFVLQALLRVTGPVTTGGETFHADDVARKLLNTVYLRFPEGPRQDAYFASAAKGIFDLLSTRPVDPVGVLRALTPMVEQRRFLAWSSHAGEQKLLAPTQISGTLPQGRAAAVRAGMYLNGSTSAKMEYYLDYVGGVRSVGCSADGVQQFQARLRLHSTAPRDVSGLPGYVTGDGRYAPKGTMLDRLFVYGPAGGRVVRLEANGQQRRLIKLRDGTRPVVFQNLLIKPGGSLDIVATFETSAGQKAAPTFDWTPGMHPGPSSVSAPSTCG